MRDLLSRIAFPGYRRMRVMVVLLAVLLIPLETMGQTPGNEASQLLEVGDTVQMSVEGRPDLELLLVIDAEGRVSIPQVGQIALAGLSLQDAGRILRQRLRVFDPGLVSVQVQLGSSAFTSIQIQGAVSNPGTFTFDSSPSVWDLIQRSGGILDRANLVAARVIREEAGTARLYPLDLTSLVVGGKIPEFVFQPGDILMVPEQEAGFVLPQLGLGTQVIGAVTNPSVIQLSTPQPLLEVLMLAGAPRENAKLREIWLVHNEGGRFLSKIVDLTLFLEEGEQAGNPLVYPGDTLRVSFQEPSWFRRNIPMVLGSMTAIATIWLAYDRISE